MKREYSRPDIMYEDFSLSAGIAAGCEKIISTHTSDQCAMRFGDMMLFVGTVSACLDPVVDGSPDYNGLCYHVPIDTKNIFNS